MHHRIRASNVKWFLGFSWIPTVTEDEILVLYQAAFPTYTENFKTRLQYLQNNRRGYR